MLRPFVERRNDRRGPILSTPDGLARTGRGSARGLRVRGECMDDPFSRMHDPARRAERYRKVAAEYDELASDAASPFLRAYFQRIAEQYRQQAAGELRVVEQDGAAIRERA